jgi:hypothetical protein
VVYVGGCKQAGRAADRRPAKAAACVVLVALGVAGLSGGSTDSTRAADEARASAGHLQPGGEHRWITLARRYRAAVRDGDVERVLAMQAPDARVWFDEKTGHGRPLDARGKGPWADWDMFFRARSSQTDFVVEGNAVRFTNHESNDWFRLVERTSLPYHVFYFFDESDRITGKLIRGIAGQERVPDRLSEFQVWAESQHPGLVQSLMPDGNIDPDLEKARLWKKHLLEWRAETGLPNVLDDPE